jgi:hypothetical protein
MQNDLILTSLQDLIKTPEAIKALEPQLMSFNCKRDTDIESFIHNKAIDYERSGYSRTYLYSAPDPKANNEYSIVAYFTVAITSVSFADISKKKKSKVLGGFPGRDTQDHFAGLLIAQLARSDDFDKTYIDSKRMITDAESIITKGRKYLGGKLIYVDCKEPLIQLYSGFGYKLIIDGQYANGLYKLFKVLPKIS